MCTFFFNDTATTEIYTLSLHDALPISKSAPVFKTVDPANGKKLATITEAGKTEVNSAVNAAKQAFPKWNDLSGHERARYLYAIARQIQKHSRLFAVLESMDNGKTIRETRDIDVPQMIRHFYHHFATAIDAELIGSKSFSVIFKISKLSNGG